MTSLNGVTQKVFNPSESIGYKTAKAATDSKNSIYTKLTGNTTEAQSYISENIVNPDKSLGYITTNAVVDPENSLARKLDRNI